MGLTIGQDRGEADAQWVHIAWDEARGYVWWLDHEPPLADEDADRAKLLVARANNPDAKRLAREQARDTSKLQRRAGGRLPDDLSQKLLRDRYAQTILKDWTDVDGEDGRPVEYTPEVGAQMFAADEEFLELVIDIANESAVFHREAVQQDAEALGEGSGGKQDGDDT